jgi:hypothetical protein
MIIMTLSDKVCYLVVYSRHVELVLLYKKVTPTKTRIVDKSHLTSRLYSKKPSMMY